MSVKNDVLVIGAAALGAWYFLKYMRDQAINSVADLIPALSPPGFTELQKALVSNDIQPVDSAGSVFHSGLADWLTGQQGGTYAIVQGYPALYIVMSTGEYMESGLTKTDMINRSRDYYKAVAEGTALPSLAKSIDQKISSWLGF